MSNISSMNIIHLCSGRFPEKIARDFLTISLLLLYVFGGLSHCMYSQSALNVEKLTSRLNCEENALRLSLLKQIISAGAPIDLPATSEDHAAKLCSGLVEKKLLVLDAQQKVQFAYPVSALPTPHRVRLADGRSLYAMCAIDAMGTAFTFEQDVTIHSSCSHCSESIQLSLRDGQIETLQPMETHVIHVDLNNFGDWSGSC